MPIRIDEDSRDPLCGACPHPEIAPFECVYCGERFCGAHVDEHAGDCEEMRRAVGKGVATTGDEFMAVIDQCRVELAAAGVIVHPEDWEETEPDRMWLGPLVRGDN